MTSMRNGRLRSTVENQRMSNIGVLDMTNSLAVATVANSILPARDVD
jgi:hypothetical protein